MNKSIVHTNQTLQTLHLSLTKPPAQRLNARSTVPKRDSLKKRQNRSLRIQMKVNPSGLLLRVLAPTSAQPAFPLSLDPTALSLSLLRIKPTAWQHVCLKLHTRSYRPSASWWSQGGKCHTYGSRQSSYQLFSIPLTRQRLLDLTTSIRWCLKSALLNFHLYCADYSICLTVPA